MRRFRDWYAKLLHLYPKPYYERFGEGIEQTFNDLLRERKDSERALFPFVMWMYAETFAEALRESLTSTNMQNITKRLSVWAVIVAALLSIPFVAMRLGAAGVNWSRNDFITAGCLLFGSALVYELATRKATTTRRRVAVGIAVATVLVYVWVELAVGVFTNWGS